MLFIIVFLNFPLDENSILRLPKQTRKNSEIIFRGGHHRVVVDERKQLLLAAFAGVDAGGSHTLKAITKVSRQNGAPPSPRHNIANLIGDGYR